MLGLDKNKDKQENEPSKYRQPQWRTEVAPVFAGHAVLDGVSDRQEAYCRGRQDEDYVPVLDVCIVSLRVAVALMAGEDLEGHCKSEHC